MSDFNSVDITDAYKFVEPKKACLIASKGAEKNLYNITPIAWVMPMDYEPVSKVIFSCDPSHQVAKNIKRTKQFAVCVPQNANDPIIEKCGSVSSPDADKFAMFGISGSPAEKIDVLIPKEHCESWLECECVRVIEEGSVELFVGQAVAAYKK